MGELKLYVSRYLHMQVELSASRCEVTADKITSEGQPISDEELDKQLENPANDLKRYSVMTADTTELQPCITNTYLFSQKRKMRSKELHYLDNPVFGLLVYVTPFKPGIPQEETM